MTAFSFFIEIKNEMPVNNFVDNFVDNCRTNKTN